MKRVYWNHFPFVDIQDVFGIKIRFLLFIFKNLDNNINLILTSYHFKHHYGPDFSNCGGTNIVPQSQNGLWGAFFFFRSKLKIRDYAKITAFEFQNVPYYDKANVLKKCCIDMC